MQQAWRLMGGTIEWTALGTIVAILGVKDAERLIYGLVTYRELLAEKGSAR